MAQFLLVTTLVTIAGLIATMIAGVIASPGHNAQHIMFALATVVVGLFSQSMTMFFFIGTGKQLKDKTAGQESEAAVKSATRALTMKVSPIATYAMLILMVTFIMGGGVSTGKTPHWLHNVLSAASLLIFLRAYWVEINAMNANAEMMSRFMRDTEPHPSEGPTPAP
jgi:Na+/melibiose symporter-like transporter